MSGLLLPNATSAQSPVNPLRISEGPEGELLVTDRTRNSIFAIDKGTLDTLWSFPIPNDGEPFGIAAGRKLVFVSNTVTGNVEVYEPSKVKLEDNTKSQTFALLFTLGHAPVGGPGFFQNPVDVVLDEKGDWVFVLDSEEKKIKVFDTGGILLNEWAPADALGRVMSPVALAIDPSNQEILVTDYGNPSGVFGGVSMPGRILIYSYAGELKFEIAGDGSTHSSTSFLRIQGLATDGLGRLFAPDTLRGVVMVLSRETGELLGELGSSGPDPGQLMLPLDLLLDPKSGDLFVVNNQGARRVEVLRGAGVLP